MMPGSENLEPPEPPTWLDLIREVEKELKKARAEFPRPDHLVLAFHEEAGEMTRAVLGCMENRHGLQRVEEELVQTMAMLVRLWEEGDPSVDMGSLQRAYHTECRRDRTNEVWARPGGKKI